MNVNVLLPLALLFLGLRGTKREASSGPTTPEGRALEAKLAVALAKKEAATRSASPRPGAAAKPPPPAAAAAPKTQSDAAAQAAVNAAVATAVKDAVAKQRAAGNSPSADEQKLAAELAIKEANQRMLANQAAAIATDAPAPSTTSAPAPIRTPQQAATDLRAFLQRTHRFGSPKDRPDEIRAAQRDLKVKDDGIIGPVTRAAAKKAGVTLPTK